MKYGTALFHDVASNAHLLFKVRVVWRDAQTIGCVCDVELIALFQMYFGKQFLRKDSPTGLAIWVNLSLCMIFPVLLQA